MTVEIAEPSATLQPLPPTLYLDEVYEPVRQVRDVQADLQEALRSLRMKRPGIDLRWAYHDGNHPTPWLTDRHRRAFGGHFNTDLSDNYTALVVAAIVLRLAVQGWQGKREDTPSSEVEQAAALWDANALGLEQEELWQQCVAAGEGYIIAWPRDTTAPDGSQQQARDERTGTPLYDFVINDARNVYLRQGQHRRDRLWAAKVWRDERTKKWRATMYYPDEVIRFATKPRDASSGFPERADAFTLDPADPGGPNDMRTVPVFRFARDRRGRSVIDLIRSNQDKINKLGANKMVTAEFLAWPQRYALVAGEINDDDLRPRPGAFLTLDPGGEAADEAGNVTKAPPTQVGQFAAADLSNYDNAKREEVQALLTIAMMPRRLQVTSGDAPSGEAVRADEGPFVSVVQDWQQMLGGTLSDLYDALGLEVVPTWKPAEISNSKSVADEVLVLVQAGVPIEIAVQYAAGWDAEQVDALHDAVLANLSAQASVGSMALAAADAGRDPAQLVADGMSPEDIRAAFDALGVAIRAGVDPVQAAKAVGLPNIAFTGAVPTSLRLPSEDAAGLESGSAGR